MTHPDLEAWRRLRDPVIAAFIAEHETADVPALALRRPPDAAWPWRLILDQIAARQKARGKMPAWLAVPGIVLPPSDIVEQASSAATARYKATLAGGDGFADLTAGAGVDTLAFLRSFRRGIAVEADPLNAAALAHNLPLLDGKPCPVRPMRAEDAIEQLPPCDFIFLDPQRRQGGKRGIFRLEDGAPDIVGMRAALLNKVPLVMLKASPMLDIDAAVKSLATVIAVHVVEWRQECREVLYLMDRHGAAAPDIHAVMLNDDGTTAFATSFMRGDNTPPDFAPPAAYLFEPSPAMQKAGATGHLARMFGLAQLHPHTHLLTGDRLPEFFPGRSFRVEGVYGAGGKDLPLRQASVTVRNFPLAAEALRRKLGLADGGADTLFACTLMDGKKALIHARKA